MDSIRRSKFHPRYHRHNNGLYLPTRSPAVGSYSTEVLADSPIWWLKLNEASGTPVDQMGGTISIRDINSYAVAVCRPSGSPGIKLSNLSTSYVEVTTPATTFDASLAMSWEVWLRDISGTGYLVMMGKDDTAGGTIAYLIQPGGTLPGAVTFYATIKNSGNSSVAETTTVNTSGTNTHIVFTCTSGTNPTTSIYLNGSLVNSGAHTTTRHNGGSIRLGASADPFFKGCVGTYSDFAGYQSVLSPARVLAHYLAG